MPSVPDEVLAVPLRLVCARFSISFSPEAREDIVCVANGCVGSLRKNNVVKAYSLTRCCQREKIELTKSSEKLRQLALWLVCPRHEENIRETVARGWEKRCLDDDIFDLLGLDPQELRKWSCPENGCHESVIYACTPDVDGWSRVIDIMEELTPSAVVRETLSDDDRAGLVTELVGLLHCDDHRNSENSTQLSNKWNNILTETVQRRKPENKPRRRLTPRKGQPKNALNQDTTPPQAKSEAERVGSTSGKGSFDSLPSSSDSRQSNEDPFGHQSGFAASERSSGALFGHKSSSDGVESPNTAFTAPKFNPDNFESSSKALAWKLVLEGKPNSPFARQSRSLNSELLSPSSSPPSSRKRPASTAEQIETASPGVKGPVVLTAEDQARHSTSSCRTASPLSKPSPVDGAQGGSPVTNGLGHSLSAAQETAKPRSHSSSDIRVFGQQSRHNRPSQPRSTQSYPDLASESRNHGSDTERVVPTEMSPISSSVEAQENALFTAAYKKTFKHGEIDTSLLRYIRSITADNGKRVNSSSGDVYVLQNPAWPNHVKIGESGRDVDTRIKELKRSCEIDSLEQVVDTEQKYFLNYKIVEKLCHEELKNFRKNLLCGSCKASKGKQKRHEEWFQVEPEIAVRTVQKWRKWMSLSPYDGDGDLVPWWREKANDELFFKEEPFDVKEEAIDDHDNRHQRWSRWLKRPTVKERIDFEIERFFLHTRPRRKSVWNRAEENLVPLLIYFFYCEIWLAEPLSSMAVL